MDKTKKTSANPLMKISTDDKGAPRWYILYGDLLSVILIFFILLFSMSSTSKVKYNEGVKSIQEALLTEKQQSEIPKTDTDRLIEIKEQLDKNFQNSEMRNYISTDFDAKGIKITVKDSIFFRVGDSALLSTAVPVLNTIAKALNAYKFPIIVEGHTDNIPIRTDKFPSNWELSTARASSVTRFFINYGRIDPNLLAAVGYAEFRPVKENDSPANRAKNRRVEIKILEE